MSTRSQLRFIQRIEYENDDGEVESTTRIAQTEKSFERATWQFEGPLTDALENFLSAPA